MRGVVRRCGCLLLSACLWACSAADDAGSARRSSSTNASSTCTAGETLTCYCSDGSEAMQTCHEGGVLDPCPCTAGGSGSIFDAPRPGNTVTGGTGGAGGAGSASSGALCPELAAVGACSAPAAYQAEQLPAYVMFVLDRSGSMNCNAPPTQSQADCDANAVQADMTKPSKWDVVADAMRGLFDDLAGQGLYAGLTLFSTDSMCGVDSEPLVEVAALDAPHASTLGAALDAFPPRGETPIVGATVLAYRHLHDELAVQGNRFVVLITDGAESCDVDQIPRLLDEEVPKSRDALTRTFVIGAPGSEPGRGLLSELAYRGGTARTEDCTHVTSGTGDVGDCHYDMTTGADFAAELSDALAEIGGAALGCEFPVPTDGTTPATENNVNVQYVPGGDGTPECLPAGFDVPCDDPSNEGWQFATHPDGTKDLTRVLVCGAACDRIGADPDAKVEIIVGCPPLE